MEMQYNKGWREVFRQGGWGHSVNDFLLINAAVHVCHSTIAAKFLFYYLDNVFFKEGLAKMAA